jgi:hypothetical protein
MVQVLHLYTIFGMMGATIIPKRRIPDGKAVYAQTRMACAATP